MPKGLRHTKLKQRAVIALRRFLCGWCGKAVNHPMYFVRNIERLNAKWFAKRDNFALSGATIKERTFRNVGVKHFFEAHRLGTKLNSVGIVCFGAASFVLNGEYRIMVADGVLCVGFVVPERDLRRRTEFDNVGDAVQTDSE